jgi:hypothetical protein
MVGSRSTRISAQRGPQNEIEQQKNETSFNDQKQTGGRTPRERDMRLSG